MGLSERRDKTNKIIKKRLKIVKEWRFPDSSVKHPIESQPHSLHKNNLSCNCGLCKYYKHIGNSKKKYSHKDLILIEKYGK
jgi:hypothetical protein